MRKTRDVVGSLWATSAPRRMALWLWLLVAVLLPGLAVAAAGPTLSFSYPATPERDYAAPANVKVLLNATSGCGPINIFVSGPGLDTSINNGDTLNNLPPGRYFIDASFEMCNRQWIDPVSAGRAFNVLGGSITASPGTCTIPWGGSSCTSTINWSSNAPSAQIWYSLPNGSGMTLWTQGQNGSALAGIDTNGRRFYLKSGDLTLATVDVAAVPTNNSAPTVGLTAPGHSYVYQLGAAVRLAANASDTDDGVQRVEFLIDGVKVGEDISAPYELNWVGTEGGHTLVARAFDTRGVSTSSAGMWIVGNGRPVITLTSPANGAQANLPASFVLRADASDWDGVNRVEFYADSQLVNTDTVAPYEYTWSGVGVGSHSVHAIVHDNLGASVQSATANVTVSQPPSGPTGVARRYVYDLHQQLCKVIEPETGATVMGYDAAGNLAWSAAGLDLPDQNNCNTNEGYASGRRVDRGYDQRNRLHTLVFPDGRGNQTWVYTPDGLAKEISTSNDGPGLGVVVNTYAYNKRRLLTAETQALPGDYTGLIAYAYDAYGNRSQYTTPDGQPISYANNALGQPVSVSSNWGNHATGISYYPNGAIKQFTYGNGVVHTLTQNARQLPSSSADAGVARLDYTYDPNGNVNGILDRVRGDTYSRWMTYDYRDRLTAAGSCSFLGDCWHRFTYDPLDNLKSWTLGGVKDHATYYYDDRNRLTNIRNSAGAAVLGLGYDPQGNLENKNGQAYQFDYGNRLRTVVGKEAYLYDAQGRRVATTGRPDTTYSRSFYNLDGQMVMSEDHHTAEAQNDSRPELTVPHVYLNGSLLATIEWNRAAGNGQVKYHHTDALGSPIAVTNAAGAVIDRTDWEPYGAAIGKTNYNGVGYTGHVMDGATGLTYMQQRYYDQNLGRFLSVDPVTADVMTGGNFNRYKYANNNPYRFVDPDGRQEFTALRAFLVFVGTDVATPDPSDAAAPGKAAVYGSAIAGLAIGGGITWLANQAMEGGSSAEGGSQGDLHAPGDAPDGTVIVRGGVGDMPEPGELISGSQGDTVADAAAGVPHGTISTSTAGEIRAAGGKVEVAPEPTRSGTINGKHVNVIEGGKTTTFGPRQPNPVPREDRIK
ncbi:Ig-like domain-containing protein [Lysobacter sp. Root983]|uniref:RHS repeat domain-containing protein n=1 Tax=Lysobacter sp. Root983 TaxID=1736613 RepID=UPI000A5F8AFB|nr:Ig-like domain-containing protein [Lysobacter sp. Root983]